MGIYQLSPKFILKGPLFSHVTESQGIFLYDLTINESCDSSGNVDSTFFFLVSFQNSKLFHPNNNGHQPGSETKRE